MLKYKLFIAIFIALLVLNIFIGKVEGPFDLSVVGLMIMAPFALYAAWVLFKSDGV